MCKHILSLHFSCLPSVSVAKVSHMGKASVSVGGDRAHGQFEYITATIYHPGFAEPATLPIKAWKDIDEGLSSGMVLHI